MLALRVEPTFPLRWSFALIIVTAVQLLGLIPPLPAIGLAALGFVTVAAIQLSGTLWNTTLQQQIPEHVLSRVVAYDWLVSLVFMPLGYVAAAPLAEAIGTDTTLACLAGVNAAACVGILLVPSVRNMRRRDEEIEDANGAAEPALADAVL